MAAAPVLLAGALALLAAPASAQSFPLNPAIWSSSSEYTTSSLFNDLLLPRLCAESSNYDACYGCFTRYSRMIKEQAAYEELKKCASQYLNDTLFAECSAPIVDAKGNLSQRPSVFCDFEKCVRKSNMHQVLEECVKQSDNSKSEADKYIQTTSCILEELHHRKYKTAAGSRGDYYSPNEFFVYVKDGELRTAPTLLDTDDSPSCDRFHTLPDEPFLTF